MELACLVLRVYGENLETGIDNAVEGNGTLKHELAQLPSDACLISFNYDLLGERILAKERGRNCYVLAKPSIQSEDTKDRILLCKPHGSVDWRRRVPERGSPIEFPDRPMTEKEFDWDESSCTYVQPLFEPPVPFKTDIIFPEGQGEVPNAFQLLVTQWSTLISYISRAEKLVLVGYSFPKEDLHAQYMFREAAARRDQNLNLEIEVYQRDPESFAKTSLSLMQVFQTERICYRGPVRTW